MSNQNQSFGVLAYANSRSTANQSMKSLKNLEKDLDHIDVLKNLFKSNNSSSVFELEANLIFDDWHFSYTKIS